MNETNATPPYREIADRLRRRVGLDAKSPGDAEAPDGAEAPDDAEALIGSFQAMRGAFDDADQNPLAGLFEGLAGGDRLHHRLSDVFTAAGDGRRPGGGRDAYFVVRGPGGDAPAWVEQRASGWIDGLIRYANAADVPDAASPLDSVKFRVLEGIPPKQPKKIEDHTGVLKSLRHDIPAIASATAQQDEATHRDWLALQNAYYFIACDPMLRDHLMWPLNPLDGSVDDPFADYFELWKRGIKFRSYGEGQLDLYLPRSTA